MLVVKQNIPKGVWPLGRVVEVNCGRDGLVHSAREKSVRPINKLHILEAAELR